MKRFTRPINELWRLWEPRARMGIYPFDHTVYEDAKSVVTSLSSYDRDTWASAFSSVAARYEEAGIQAEKHGSQEEAKSNYLHAYSFYRMARFPTTNSDGKRSAYRKSQDLFFKAARFFEVPLERIEMPFRGHAGERDRLVAYLQTPPKKGAASSAYRLWRHRHL